jgi:hypothetical protein
VDRASLAAARAGAVSGGDESKMTQAAILALAPLYANAKNSELKDALKGAGKDMGVNVVGAPSLDLGGEDGEKKVKIVAKGTTGFLDFPDSHGDPASVNSFGFEQLTPAKVLEVKILSPTKAMMDGFGVTRKIGDEKIKVIPNDNLMYRNSGVKSGEANIQDANLLKIKLTYLYELKMPMTRYFFTPLMDPNLTRRMFGADDTKILSEAAQEIFGNFQYRIPLVSYSTVRMQSDMKESAPLPDRSNK